ncbi:MAG: crossover junction endodeoxyribonuclease RuvC [Rhizobiales bacterium]|nr:crossover junction endodeoxyribonuclease RuvC [Hyphomicrobiales bacterium]
MSGPIRIIGIDPGLRRTGWGVVDSAGSRLSFVAAGTILPDDKLPLAQRLCLIHDGLARVLEEFSPDEAAVEATFVNRDAAATLKLGQARGVAMLVPARAGLTVAEYAPNAVKKTVVGAGHAEKRQIRVMVAMLLPRAVFDSDDSADALAVAICHAHHRGAARRFQIASVS